MYKKRLIHAANSSWSHSVCSFLSNSSKEKKEREKENQLKTIWTLISDNKSI